LVKVSIYIQLRDPELVLLEEEAKSLGRGMWGDPVLPPKVSHSIEDHRAFFNAHSRTPIPAIVEQVRDGSTLRCLLLLPNNVHQSIIINIAGIKCPIFCKNVPNMPDVVEPFSQEAKYFVETRLLQRKVEIQLETITGSMFYASIIFPAGNIALLLLSNGYAKVVEWNLNTIKGDKTPYIEAEAIAIQKKLRLWKETAKTKISADTFEAVVHRAPGTDHIIVYYQDQERKLQISSIRGPKRQKNEQDFDIGYYVDAIEFIRSRLVGQKVSVKVDYVKPRDGQYGPRDCCTIMLDGVDIGEQLVAHGLASVLKHKKDDHNRSSRYDFLIQAEEKAAEEGKGIHSKKDLPVHRYVDVTENVQKAKSFLPSLQRSGKLNAIVEFVSSGSRYRLLVPSQNCRMTFVLAGVKLPRPPKGEKDTGEPYGQEAVNFCNKIAIQRQVEIQAHSVDKVGMFIGTMNVQTEHGLKDLGLMLVDAGFASVHDFSAASLPLYHQLKQAEDRAKQARKNIWLDYSEKSEDTENISEVVNAKLEGCVVSEVCSDGGLFIQYLADCKSN
jgi:staphylococcal nuclease domain-containing protein 1